MPDPPGSGPGLLCGLIVCVCYWLILTPVQYAGEPFQECTLDCPGGTHDCAYSDNLQWCRLTKCSPCIDKETLTCHAREQMCVTRYSLGQASFWVHWVLGCWSVGVVCTGLYLIGRVFASL